jgi:tetratricopeptide (TPR) repeat protein
MRRWAAVTAALVFAFLGEYWSQAVIAEVYTLNTLLILLCLFVLLEWYETRRSGLLYALAFCFGLGMANHNTMMLCGPVFVGFILFVDRQPLLRWRTYAACTALSLAVALLLYLYLPIASMRNTAMDWGNPETLGNWWAHVTRKQYAFAFTANARNWGRFMGQLRVLAELYTEQFTPWLAVLPLAGGYVLWRRSRVRFGFMLAFLATIELGFTLLTNFRLEKEAIWLNGVFYIPAYLVAAFFLGLALDALAALHKKLMAPAVALGAGSVILLLLTHYAECDKSRYYFAYDYGMNILNTMDKDAVYFPSGDHPTFPPIYLQAVEGIRPDILLAKKYGYPDESVYKDMPGEQRNGFHRFPTIPEKQTIEDWVITHSGRPVYVTRTRSMAGVPGARLVDAGLLYRVVPDGESWSPRDWWGDYRWHSIDKKDAHGDYTAGLILRDYWLSHGRMELSRGNANEAAADFDRGFAMAGLSPEALNHAGCACAEAGQLEAAKEYFNRSLKLAPDFDFTLRSLGKVYMREGEFAKALELFDRVLAKQPKDEEAKLLSAECLRKLGRVGEAESQAAP